MAENEIKSDANTISEECALSENLPLIYHNKDIWRKIALKLDRSSLYKLICSWKWFAVVVMTDDTIWKDLLLRDLGVTVPVGGDLIIDAGVTWKNTYDTVFAPPPAYNPIYIDAHYLIAGARLGGVIMSPSVWMGTLAHELTTEELNQHGYFVSNLLPGLWVADVYTGICPACEAVCGETKTILSLWHSKLYLLDGLDFFCPNTMSTRYADSRSGFIIDQSADDALDLANLANLCFRIGGLNLEYKLSEKGLTVEFTDYEGEQFETEFRVTRDRDDRAVAIQIQHIGHHLPFM